MQIHRPDGEHQCTYHECNEVYFYWEEMGTGKGVPHNIGEVRKRRADGNHMPLFQHLIHMNKDPGNQEQDRKLDH